MRSFTATAAVLAAITSTARAGVTLGDFMPYLTDLTGNCANIYHTNIQRCSSSDFTGSGCSSTCIAGLTALSPAVQGACSNAGVTGNNVVAAFLSGVGVTNLCPNAQSNPPMSSQQQTTTSQQQTSTQSPSTTSETPSSTSTQESTSSPSTSSTSQATTSSTATSTPGSSSSSSSTSASSSSAKTTSSSNFVFSPTSSSSSSSSETSSAAASSSSPVRPVANSGGGSPFDTPTVPGAAATSAYSVGLLIATLLGTLILMR